MDDYERKNEAHQDGQRARLTAHGATDRLQYFLNCLGLTKKQLGVTAHGLRAGYCEDRAIELGLIPPTRGGMPGQMSKAQEKLVKTKLSEDMKHSRISVTGAYCGTVRSVASSKQQEN